ncbi:MAG: hypothetical protein WC389_19680 [Lutibacter sp.]|jgi:hypothetical protein
MEAEKLIKFLETGRGKIITKKILCRESGIDKQIFTRLKSGREINAEQLIAVEDTFKLLIRDLSKLVSEPGVTGLFLHYDNGVMVNIQDLSKPEYEKFIEQMNSLRMAYITLVSRP